MKRIKKGQKYICIKNFTSTNGDVLFKEGNVYESLSDTTLCSKVNKDHPIQSLLGDGLKYFFKRDKREPITLAGTNIYPGINWTRIDTSFLMTDPIVEEVIKNFRNRSAVGIKKYGTTLESNNTDDFLQHAIEESMDFILYLQKIKSILKKKGFNKLEELVDERKV